MVSISHVVRKIVNDKIFIQEAMVEGIISYGSLARQLKSDVEKELGRTVKTHAIVMALKRYADELKQTNGKIVIDKKSDITLKTHICDISVLKSPSSVSKLREAYDIINFEAGDFLEILEGKSEVSILTNERYKEKLLTIFRDEKILSLEDDLVSLTITGSRAYKYTPGVMFNIIRSIVWENINIYKVTTTDTTLTLILNKKDAVRAYNAIERLISNHSKRNNKK